MPDKREDEEPEERGDTAGDGPGPGDAREPKGPKGDGARKPFRADPDATQNMIEAVFRESTHQLEREVQLAVARRVLGDTELFCPECGGFCHSHIALLRDRFLKRAYELTSELVTLLDLYFRQRQVGIETPWDVLELLYGRWSELTTVYELSEPQERIDPTELLPGGYRPGDDPGDPFADGDEDA